MRTLVRQCWPLLVMTLTTALRAQQADPDEFVALEPVLRAALQKAAPFTVTIETVGGARRVLKESDGANDGQGDTPPKPTPPPQTPPQPAPDDGKDKKKPQLQLQQPGFHQNQGRTTGVVLTADGWILVSRFALNFDPSTITVTLADGRTLPAVRKGEDTSRGIALVKIAATGLTPAEFVPPPDVKVGQWAFALGRTFGVDEPTVHIGIVSAVRRQFGRALQIDAYTSPANYGGPVVDVLGRVLGIAVPLSPAGRDAGVEWYDSGIGFAATIADIPELIDRMQHGEVLHRGWLGVTSETKYLGPGAKLMAVPATGVAAKAGLHKGDIIQEIDGVPVANSFHLQMLVSSHMGGDAIALKVRQASDDAPVDMTVILADTPFEERQQKKDAELPPSFPLPEKK